MKGKREEGPAYQKNKGQLRSHGVLSHGSVASTEECDKPAKSRGMRQHNSALEKLPEPLEKPLQVRPYKMEQQ